RAAHDDLDELEPGALRPTHAALPREPGGQTAQSVRCRGHAFALVAVPGGEEARDELVDAELELAPDPADLLEAGADRVAHPPVLVPLAWGELDSTDAAAERHDDVGRVENLAAERLRVGVGEVDPDLGHRRDHVRVELRGHVRARRDRVDASAGADHGQGGGHLAAAPRLQSDEDDLRTFALDRAFDLAECPEPVAREPLAEGGDVAGNRGVPELGERFLEDPLDRRAGVSLLELLEELLPRLRDLKVRRRRGRRSRLLAAAG